MIVTSRSVATAPGSMPTTRSLSSPAEPPSASGERHQRRIAGRTRDVAGIHFSPAMPSTLIMTPLPRDFMSGVKSAAHVDVAEHLQVPCLPPTIFGDLLQIRRRDAPALFTSMSMSACPRGEFVNVRLSEISSACTCDRTFHRAEMLSRTASRSVFVRATRMTLTPSSASFAGAAADALGRAGDQSGPAAQVQVQGFLPVLKLLDNDCEFPLPRRETVQASRHRPCAL